MHIEISIRHGVLDDAQHEYLRLKAEKLHKYFERLMSVEVAVEQMKYLWRVEILASAEHKHDFVATEESNSPQEAMDLCVHKVEQQLRRYKEKVQHHKGDTGVSEVAGAEPEPEASPPRD